MRLLKWRGWDTERWPGERALSNLKSVWNELWTTAGEGIAGGCRAGRCPGALRYPPRAMVFLTPAAGGACDWLRADGRRADWLLGDQGPGRGAESAPEPSNGKPPTSTRRSQAVLQTLLDRR